ncbi:MULTISPECIES: DUF433 domain-containing protein [unclassified Spirosoma]|uniref:DUF433 domain-containing protein n=1 Tax=unclassified Spirosoma TaxID=2621999 RepID=UPI00095DA3CC|nr:MULTISPECIES: DUF433 domain-containing protein [unclassified Spirosoma]MBN8823118.1 DUF433 domain-containing protein [Spirosoma sp.]OJW73207.1 MAG: antitoxin [Spirosoma sp. 48-14]
MNWRDYITSDPTIMFGKPVIKGTRVPVDLVLEKLGNGETIPQLLASYPRVREEAFYACLLFASETVKNEVVYAQAG